MKQWYVLYLSLYCYGVNFGLAWVLVANMVIAQSTVDTYIRHHFNWDIFRWVQLKKITYDIGNAMAPNWKQVLSGSLITHLTDAYLGL